MNLEEVTGEIIEIVENEDNTIMINSEAWGIENLLTFPMGNQLDLMIISSLV